MKYIVFEDGPAGLEMPTAYVFPDYIQHDSVAWALATRRGIPILGAGFCRVQPKLEVLDVPVERFTLETSYEPQVEWLCWGESTSLGIQSRLSEDAKVLARCFRG